MENKVEENRAEETFDQEKAMQQLLNMFEEQKKESEEKLKKQEQTIFYLRSDIENIKRNTMKEIEQTTKKTATKIISSFLSVLDDYERSLSYAKEEGNTKLINGLQITYNSFLKTLKDLGVEEIDTTGLFNPEFHEAITTINNPEKKENEIEQVVLKGYTYKKSILRPAQVIIVES